MFILSYLNLTNFFQVFQKQRKKHSKISNFIPGVNVITNDILVADANVIELDQAKTQGASQTEKRQV